MNKKTKTSDWWLECGFVSCVFTSTRTTLFCRESKSSTSKALLMMHCLVLLLALRLQAHRGRLGSVQMKRVDIVSHPKALVDVINSLHHPALSFLYIH